MSKNPRIIFIHGIGDKPPKQDHIKEWLDALILSTGKLPKSAVRMAYWADLRGDLAIDVRTEVVRAMHPVHKKLLVSSRSTLERRLSLWERILHRLITRVLTIADPLVREFLEGHVEDVSLYFYEQGKREAISSRLITELEHAAHEGRRTAVIAHSMGTVIALDVLSTWGDPVDLLVTMGAPLGSEWIQFKLGDPPYPNNVARWVNVYDREDTVSAADPRLANDFRHNPEIEDHAVRDNFSPSGKRDPHHWYGYLSSKEVGEAVSAFWGAPRSSVSRSSTLPRQEHLNL